MKKLLAFTVGLALATPLAAADLSGVWTLDAYYDTRPPVEMVITFKQNGERLAGDCAGDGLQFTVNGEVHGNSVKWTCTSGDIIATFDATINDTDAEMKGAWETIAKGTFTATKQK